MLPGHKKNIQIYVLPNSDISDGLKFEQIFLQECIIYIGTPWSLFTIPSEVITFCQFQTNMLISFIVKGTRLSWPPF